MLSEAYRQGKSLIQDIDASPVSLDFIETQKSIRKAQDPHQMVPAQIIDEISSFNTRIFLIRYCDEIVQINDICSFRIELPLQDDFINIPIFIETELMFSDPSGNVKGMGNTVVDVNNQTEFQSISTVLHKLACPLKGIHEYVPVVFDMMHFCVANTLVHCVLLDIRVCPGSFNSTEENSDDKGLHHALCQVLFGNSKRVVRPYIGAVETNRAYNDQMSILAVVYEGIRANFYELWNKCASSATREKLAGIYIPEVVKLPFYGSSNTSSDTFADRVASHDPVLISKIILEDIHIFAEKIYSAYDSLRKLCKTIPGRTVRFLRGRHSENMLERCEEFVVKENRTKWDFTIKVDENLGEQHEARARDMRRNPYFHELESQPIVDINFFPSIDTHPVFFEEVYTGEQFTKIESDQGDSLVSPNLRRRKEVRRGVHIIALVHGFQGNSMDMRLIKDHIALAHPDALVVASRFNEGLTEGDIEGMGERLSREVRDFIRESCGKKKPAKISFIGHSLGGLIIRAALPFFEDLSDRMHLFLTLSSPHLGLMYNTSKLVDAGMWFLRRTRNSYALEQLSMGDGKHLRNTLLYRLSKYSGLEWFDYIVLVSSSQDSYVPYHSARIEVSNKATKDADRGGIYIEMASNILSRLNMQKLIRLDVNFKVPGNIDSWIGRKAHIEMLENSGFLKMLVYRYPEFFV